MNPKWPAFLTGFGFGAFVDGIVLHQVLQWHHFVEGKRSADDLAGLQYNTLWDGIYHVASWIVLLAAVVWLWANRNEARRYGMKWFAGMLLLGWGVFNVIDEIVFHLLLQAHHIRQVENWVPYDVGYTVLGIVLALVGWTLVRSADRAEAK